jgi:hypothetical protein
VQPRHLGVCYSKGQGVRQDYVEAARMWRLSAAQGYVVAQRSLGALYAAGAPGVPQNHVEAARLFRHAAAKGDAEVQ